MSSLATVTLDDKYRLEEGRVFVTGTQALVRLPMMQRQRDRAAGLNTGGFISGYRGSPLGGYDAALTRAKPFLDRHDIHFQPGLNEDLAATALWGTQQVNLFPGATVDGVFGLWYGKGPGVDRSADPLKHANAAGTSRHGGVLVVCGDDHNCVSSTLAHQSEQILQAAMIPVLHPATVQEYIDFGLLGWAMSRFSGCWVGFKAVSETVESSASIVIDPGRLDIVLPADFPMPADGLNIRLPDSPLAQERRLHGPKMAAVAAFARANRIDRVILDSRRPRFGIVATGKAYSDVRQALDGLGIDAAAADALGLRLYKVGLTWPLEPAGARAAAAGLEEVLVVEEKRSLIEDQLVRLLYHDKARPRVVGKTDEAGRPLLPSAGEFNPDLVARVLVERLAALGMAPPALRQRLARLDRAGDRAAPASKVARIPYFCAGCSHNTSTNLPDGSRGMAGIGCHGMVTWMPVRRTATATHMGGEGATWIGQSPFTAEHHVFQNLGDGTYSHSGLLAIRAAAVSGVNITYKILFNDAVAMTGGQAVEGHLTVPAVARQVAAEGARRVVVVTDEPDKYPLDAGFPPGTDIRHRDAFDAVQRELRAIPGLTVLIYDQTCAAEKRRRRKRGSFPDPDRRLFINPAVCEGCGDCSVQSNCVAVRPLETEFGRKRQIDQSSCNKDFSCLKGFCPSFVTVHGGRIRRAGRADGGPAPSADERPLPEPALRPLDRPYAILVTGIGGTGVVTIGALLGMAAHLEGKGCTVLDQTGIAQKNGAVMSHVRIAADPASLHAVRIATGGADLVLGCDMVVAAGARALDTMEAAVTRAVINDALTPTAAFIHNGAMDFETPVHRAAIRTAVGEDNADFVDATGLATALLGDALASNLFLLGYAFQKGLVPLSHDAIDRAIALNRVAVEANRQAFRWGRLAAVDPDAVAAAAAPARPVESRTPETLDAMIERRAADLAAYQDRAYADRYRARIQAVSRREAALGTGSDALTRAAAQSLYRLMAYKDEYEVARLYTDGRFLQRLRQEFDGDLQLSFHLAPPLLASVDPNTGRPRKRTFGPWMLSALRLLARLKVLRGTRFDVFGYTAERRLERRLVADYEAGLDALVAGLTPDNHELAVQIAALPDRIRGFGHVKAASLAKVQDDERRLLDRFHGHASSAAAE